MEKNTLENGLGLETLLAPATGDLPKVESVSNDVPKAEAEAKSPSDAVAKAEKSEKAPAKEAGPSSKAEESTKDPEKLEKRLKDTRDAFTKERQTNKELTSKLSKLEEQLKVLDQKLSGTYQEPPTPSPEQEGQIRVAKTKIDLSRVVAEEKYGKDEVEKLIFAEDAPYRALEAGPEGDAIKMRVMGATFPVVEAIKVLKEREFFEKYGSDPEVIKERLLREERENLVKDLKKELGGKTHDDLKGLTGVEGVSKKDAAASADAQNPMSLFGAHFKPTFG